MTEVPKITLPRITAVQPEPIDPAHLPDVLEGFAQAKRREFATDEEFAAAFRRFEPKAVDAVKSFPADN